MYNLESRLKDEEGDPNADMRCIECLNTQEKGLNFYNCEKCDYDICDRCIKIEKRPSCEHAHRCKWEPYEPYEKLNGLKPRPKIFNQKKPANDKIIGKA